MSSSAISTTTVDSTVARQLWERGIELISHEELDEMDLGSRTDYLRELHAAQFDLGITNGPFQAYRRWQKLCKSVVDEITGELCLHQQWGDGPACLTHASVDQIDPKGAEERRKAAHRAKLAKLAEDALAYAEEVLGDTEGEKHPPSIRAKVAMDILDRSTTTSKKHEQKTEVTGQINHTVDMSEIHDRLDRLAETSTEYEITQMETQFPALNQGKDEELDDDR